jgi:spectinomycin phosphotransferase
MAILENIIRWATDDESIRTEINTTILAYYRYERIVEDVAIYGQELLLKTLGGKDRQEMYKQFIGMFEPRGVVDIAINLT